MSDRKRDLEIIYNLQWKNKPSNGGGNKANIIGMYDLPSTTLNFNVFKSYLLKNSGTADDFNVSYVTSDQKEIPINTQLDFQIALYAFRKRARNNEIIVLRLEHIAPEASASLKSTTKKSIDVETQIDGEAAGSCEPPPWFTNYMIQWKKQVVDDITSSVNNVVSNIKPPNVAHLSSCHLRKRRRMPPQLIEASNERELLKSYKLECKLENKLEKLERKTKKIKEKKLALIAKSSDSDVDQSSRSRPIHYQIDNENDKMNAVTTIDTHTVIPHMLGGETYLHEWEVINIGNAPWTSKTTLNFSWGSKALQPLETVIQCPTLKPKEKGKISTRFQVPHEPGRYESYWRFHHKGRPFGQYMYVQLVVDPFDLKGNQSVLETPYSQTTKPFVVPNDYYKYVSPNSSLSSAPLFPYYRTIESLKASTPPQFLNGSTENELDAFVCARVDDLMLNDPTDTNCSSDSDNRSVVSLTESISSKDLVIIPSCNEVAEEQNVIKEELCKKPENLEQDNFDDNNNTEETGSACSWGSNPFIKSGEEQGKSDVVVITLAKEDSDGLAYITVDGIKVAVPKECFKEEYLTPNGTLKAKKKDASKNSSISSSVEIINGQDLIGLQVNSVNEETNALVETAVEVHAVPDLENCQKLVEMSSSKESSISDVNSAIDKRLFVFPQVCPGFEVVQSNNSSELGLSNDLTSPGCSGQSALPNKSDECQKINGSKPEQVNSVTSLTSPIKNKPVLTNETVQLNQAPVMNESSTSNAPFSPENIVSSALNTARSVMQMIKPKEPGQWVSGHWISSHEETRREGNLRALAEMGFWDRDLNASLLARYNDDLNRVVAELIQ